MTVYHATFILLFVYIHHSLIQYGQLCKGNRIVAVMNNHSEDGETMLCAELALNKIKTIWQSLVLRLYD